MLGRERSVGASSVAWFCSALCSMKNLNPIGIKAARTMDQVIYEITPQRPSAAKRYQATHPELDLLRHSKLVPVGPGRSPWWLASSLIS